MNRLSNVSILLVGAFLLTNCSTSSSGNNGTLAFDESSYAVTSGSTVGLVLTLSGNTDPSGVTVTIASSGSTVAVPLSSTCHLSDAPGAISSCPIQVKGLAIGSATVTASAPGLAGASASVMVSASPGAGTLAFSRASETVIAGSTLQVTLALDDSSGVIGQTVAISSSNPAAATVSPTTCVLSTAQPTQIVTITGVAAGSASIVASAAGYVSATNAVTTQGSGTLPGTLSFGSNVQVSVGGSQTGTLNLLGSSNVSTFNATLSAANAYATISPTTCPLSTATPACHFTITGVSAGNDPISAAASGYTSPSMVAAVVSTPLSGSLHFSQAAETVSVGATTTVDLSLSGGSGVVNLPVALTPSAGVSLSRTSCSLSSNSSCTITITGTAAGSATVTASASGYPDAVNSVTVQASGGVVYGTLSFSPANVPIVPGGNAPVTLTLSGSSNVTNLSVALSTSPTGIATLGQQSCNLTTVNPTCVVTVAAAAGVTTGSATISTPAGGLAGQASAAVTVSPSATPALVYSVTPLVLSNGQTGAATPTLTMLNAPAGGVQVAFSITPPPNIGANVAISPGNFVFSSSTPSVTLNINNTAIGNPPGGPYVFSATPASTSILPASLPVYVAAATPVSRTLTVINGCSVAVVAGISGGAVYGANPGPNQSLAQCPTGSTYFASGSPVTYQCMWNNPPASSGYTLAANGGTTQFVIPAGSLTNVAGRSDVWSGGIMARMNCDANGNCGIGSCNGGLAQGLGCAIGVGFDTPQTVAEFTLLQGVPDSYDVQLINGVTVPTTMKPSGTVTPDLSNPYTNGEAGSMVTHAGTQVNWNGSPIVLNGATWNFDPGSTDTVTSSNYYNFVSGTSAGSDSCGGSHPPCPSQQACGYAMNSFNDKTGTPTYALTCGTRLGYLTADAIWKGNSDLGGGNTAPFAFYTNPGSSPYQGHVLVDCPNPPMDSGYNSQAQSNTCGCSDWTNIATPTQACATVNPDWMSYVFPKLEWLKLGCPTCYTYQFDDASSSFTASVPASTSNAANSTNYTITFCPNGVSIPPY